MPTIQNISVTERLLKVAFQQKLICGFSSCVRWVVSVTMTFEITEMESSYEKCSNDSESCGTVFSGATCTQKRCTQMT